MITFVYEAQRSIAAKVYDTAAGVIFSGGIESITRSSTTATVTRNNHGYSNGKALTMFGADQTEYNGAITVGNAAANTFTYAVSGSPATPATGGLYFTDVDSGIWMALPEVLYVTTVGGATTVKVEARIDAALPWVQVGADLTSADNGTLVPLTTKYNFVRLRRSAGTGAVLVYAQW
jgi:hypothetical protein